MMMDVYRRQAGELPERFIDLHFSDLMNDPESFTGLSTIRQDL